MLTEEDFAKFTAFRVRAMGQRLREMCEDESYDTWTFEEKVKEMIDAEDAARQARKITKLVREARFKEPAACVEDIIYMPERKLSRDRIARLAECSWVEADEVLVAISKTGSGKSYIAQALGNAACRRLLPTRYVRLADLCCELNRARMASDGSYYRAMDRFKSVKLLIIDELCEASHKSSNAKHRVMRSGRRRRADACA